MILHTVKMQKLEVKVRLIHFEFRDTYFCILRGTSKLSVHVSKIKHSKIFPV